MTGLLLNVEVTTKKSYKSLKRWPRSKNTMKPSSDAKSIVKSLKASNLNGKKLIHQSTTKILKLESSRKSASRQILFKQML